MTPPFDTELHERAMRLDDRATSLGRSGKLAEARAEYASAAEIEERCADGAPETAVRIRGILRVAAVSLWVQAGRRDAAERLARRYLSEPLGRGFRRELEDMVAQLAASGESRTG